MAATLFRLQEQIRKLLQGGEVSAAGVPSEGEIKLAICQAGNLLLKTDYAASLKMGEVIPNNAVVATYEDIAVTSLGAGQSKASLPVKPISLPRGMGLWSVYPKYTTNGRYVTKDEFIPMEMGIQNLLDSQAMINDVLGQTGYEKVDMEVYFNKDLKLLWPEIKLAMRLIVYDLSQYDDYDILPLTPEMETAVIGEVLRIYGVQLPSNKRVDATVKPKGGEA